MLVLVLLEQKYLKNQPTVFYFSSNYTQIVDILPEKNLIFLQTDIRKIYPSGKDSQVIASKTKIKQALQQIGFQLGHQNVAYLENIPKTINFEISKSKNVINWFYSSETHPQVIKGESVLDQCYELSSNFLPIFCLLS